MKYYLKKIQKADGTVYEVVDLIDRTWMGEPHRCVFHGEKLLEHHEISEQEAIELCGEAAIRGTGLVSEEGQSAE